MAERKTERQKKKAARLIADGFPLKDALVASGWSPKQAAKGRAALGRDLKRMIDAEKQKRAEQLVQLGRAYSPEERKQIARGAILDNILTGSDRAVQSIKMAGQDTEVDMFGHEAVGGVIVIQMPEAAKPGDDLPVLDAEIITEPLRLKE